MSSSTADSYVRQIKELDSALKRLNIQTKEIRRKKKEAETRLYMWMVKNNVEKHGNVTLKKIAPRSASKRKPAKQKKADALSLFTQIGVNDPEQLWEEFQMTQKVYTPKTDADGGGEVAEEKGDEDE